MTAQKKKSIRSQNDGLNRRDFIKVGGVGVLGVTSSNLALADNQTSVKNCIILMLVGGPSHIDTWDPKPDAPEEIRGPFKPIHTNVPGIDIAEHFPKMAKIANKYTIVRSMHHDESPIHETGQQLLQTGRLYRRGIEFPNYGAILNKIHGQEQSTPRSVILPFEIGNTGVGSAHGQSGGLLGEEFAPQVLSLNLDGDQTQSPSDSELGTATNLENEATKSRDSYGRTQFGASCLAARRLIERGTNLVTVNMFDTVFNKITWDCHANDSNLPTTLEDYKKTLCPTFDMAYSALLLDLEQRGLLDDTLVVAMGEFGRTYKINHRGGRDHWPGVWSILLAGGGTPGGQLVGSSDRYGSEPKDTPVTPQQIAATIYQTLGINPAATITGLDGVETKLVEADPIGLGQLA